MPALYLGHGAPTLVDNARWTRELADWAAKLPRPSAILVVSAHWESAPLTIGATTPVELTYDFYGFPRKYYDVRYDAPGAPDLAAKVRALMPDDEPVGEAPERGLDHGAYVPLTVMYPEADIPVLQISMPDLNPERLFRLGQHLTPLRDEGVLIMGSGFMTHGLPYPRVAHARCARAALVGRVRSVGEGGAGAGRGGRTCSTSVTAHRPCATPTRRSTTSCRCS